MGVGVGVAAVGFQAVVCLLREHELLLFGTPGQNCPTLSLLEPELPAG